MRRADIGPRVLVIRNCTRMSWSRTSICVGAPDAGGRDLGRPRRSLRSSGGWQERALRAGELCGALARREEVPHGGPQSRRRAHFLTGPARHGADPAAVDRRPPRWGDVPGQKRVAGRAARSLEPPLALKLRCGQPVALGRCAQRPLDARPACASRRTRDARIRRSHPRPPRRRRRAGRGRAEAPPRRTCVRNRQPSEVAALTCAHFGIALTRRRCRAATTGKICPAGRSQAVRILEALVRPRPLPVSAALPAPRWATGT